MSQQSAAIKAPYMEQKRYFLGLSSTVWQKPQERRKKYFSNNLILRRGQKVWIARWNIYCAGLCANITAEGNDCTVGYVEINAWQIPKAYRH